MKYHLVQSHHAADRRVRCTGLACLECQRLRDGGDRSWPTQPAQPRNSNPLVEYYPNRHKGVQHL